VSALTLKIIERIKAHGPISVADYMKACLWDQEHGYYATRPALGGWGEDFITAPEASQMFGELIGLWCVHEWNALQRPKPFALIELGPGRGTLISDAWRAARAHGDFRDAARLHLVERSAPLRALQAEALAKIGASADWLDDLNALAPAPSLMVANEFLDCAPIQQFVRTSEGWRERRIGVKSEALVFTLSDRIVSGDDPRIPEALLSAPSSAIAEYAEGLGLWVKSLGARLKAMPGRALVIDYAGDGAGDTLQAVKAHKKVDPLSAPGNADITARVDFTALKTLARAFGLDVRGPVGQGDFLRALGVEARADALGKAHPERSARIARELHRLTHADQMGTLFQVLCLSTPNTPAPAGF
jgi:NADH dehydrogenase [ubiquinone] 1 alpha subcomplex assembly factor 7